MTDYYIMEKFDPEQFVMNEVLTSAECIELLDITRARLSSLIRKKKSSQSKRWRSAVLEARYAEEKGGT